MMEPSIYIMTPVYDGKPHWAYAEGLAETFRRMPDVTLMQPVKGCADVSIARNTLLARAHFRVGLDIALFIDADIGFTPRDVDLVCRPIREGVGDVVSGFYPKKMMGQAQYPVRFLEEDIDEEKGYVGPGWTIGGSTYGRLDFNGMGFFAMSSRVVHELYHASQKYCPWPGFSSTNSLQEGHPFAFRPEVQLDPRQDLPRVSGEDAVGCRVIRDKLKKDIWFSFETTLTHHTSEFSFGGRRPDVHLVARQHALGNDVMRKAAKGDMIGKAEYERRMAAAMRSC